MYNCAVDPRVQVQVEIIINFCSRIPTVFLVVVNVDDDNREMSSK